VIRIITSWFGAAFCLAWGAAFVGDAFGMSSGAVTLLFFGVGVAWIGVGASLVCIDSMRRM